MLPVAILAGGLATRLRPLTEKIPKALVAVGGKPFIHRQLDYLHRQRVSRVVICTGFLGEQIEAVVGDGSGFGLSVSCSPDGPTLLGTGGALKRALPLLGKQFFVLYGDSFLTCDFHEVQQAFFTLGRPALMSVLRNANRWDRSNVLFRNGLVAEYDKREPRPEMEYIDYGLGILSADVLDGWDGGRPFDLADVYHRLSLAGELGGYEVHERFYEIGSHEGLADAEAYFSKLETR